MKKIFSLLTLAGTLGLAACSSQANTTKPTEQTAWDKVKAAGTLKVATPATLYPTSYYDKDDKGNKVLTGYEIDMLNEVAKRLNIKVEFVELGIAESFAAVDSGQVDVAVNNFEPTKERLEKYNMSTPYKHSVGGMIVREDGSSGIEKADLSDWSGKKAGGGPGTTFMKIATKQGAEPIVYDNVTNDVYLRDVSTGRTDFIPNDYFTQVIAVKLITESFPDIKVKVSETVRYNPNKAGVVMKKGETSLKDKLDETIEAMKKDGSLKTISEKHYMGQDLTKPIENADKIPVVDISDVK